MGSNLGFLNLTSVILRLKGFFFWKFKDQKGFPFGKPFVAIFSSVLQQA